MHFTNPLDPENTTIIKKIEHWVQAAFPSLGPDAEITVQDHQCADGQCLHAETIIAIAHQNRQTLLRVPKPLVYVRAHDIRTLALSATNPSTR